MISSDYIVSSSQVSSREKMLECIRRSKAEAGLFVDEVRQMKLPPVKSRADIEAERHWRLVEEFKRFGKVEFQSEYIVYAGERH
ncbi:hypothetical protein HMPREF1487_08974 [Pseudomonas sp. HPB0071]|uniref:hypothetical protein n=1 Tax=unclassified Pseudomonas TaxID=196821 RepID=UPI0002CC2A24|nr:MULTISPECIES: hypothetical protein [unclassified Pseudomonas]ENA28018.1 hypothetical protein HMPREF1487_08974 [Pseudomonas sp. HPB0071]